MNIRQPDQHQLLPAVLVVDDEVRSLDAIRRTIDEEFQVFTADGAAQARSIMEANQIHVILCDQRMPEQSGVDFLREVREQWPDTVRIIISGYTDSEDIIDGINSGGIYQYILKPWMPDHLLESVRRAADAQAMQSQTSRLSVELRVSPSVMRRRSAISQEQARNTFGFDSIARAEGSPLNQICDTASRVARYDLSVLLLGESGTGKELMARAIHYASPRAEKAFVVENCAAIPDTLLESELFGHRRGAFTGAHEDRVGLFQRANGGTVFLDEIGETSPAFQVRLLRVLQEGEVRPVGAPHPTPVNVRILAATNRDLEKRVSEGLFRQDLYYRIAQTTLTIPPLRERQGDIGPIAARLLQAVGLEMGHPAAELGADAMASLIAYHWPGNIRELRNELAQALALEDGSVLSARSFSPRVIHGPVAANVQQAAATGAQSGTLTERLNVIEAALLKETLLKHRWNKTRAAQELGLSRVGLRSKMRRFGLEST
ncbi:MAG: sigma-54-dependent transcriptional regulator [Burkholderiaceae bacterium]